MKKLFNYLYKNSTFRYLEVLTKYDALCQKALNYQWAREASWKFIQENPDSLFTEIVRENIDFYHERIVRLTLNIRRFERILGIL